MSPSAWIARPIACAAALVASIATVGVASAAPQRCDVTIQVAGATPVSALEVRVGYGAANGSFAGSADAVECTALQPGIYASANDDDGAKQLRLGMLSPSGVVLPRDLWRCAFVTQDGGATIPQFAVVVEVAVDEDSAPVSASGSVSALSCTPVSTCGNGVIEGQEECDAGGVTTSCGADCLLTRHSQRCDLGFRVTGTTPIGALHFVVGYQSAGGRFQGSGLAVDCSGTPPGVLSAADDRDVDRELRLGLVTAGTLPLPIDLWRCIFVTDATALALGKFAFQSVTAADQSLQPVPVGISAISRSCVYGPYCGDGEVDPEEGCDDGNAIDTDACTNACQVATCGDGITRTGVEQCDDGNQTSGDCCSPSCTFESSATVCRPAAGVCDQAELCTGSSGTCPADAKKVTVCRASAGVCDPVEVCDGTGNSCGADARLSGVCRAATGTCDVAETCSVASPACPPDSFQPAGTACASDGNPCTNDQCNGAGLCAHPGNSAPCEDSLFCNGSDTCSGGSCSVHAGNPCPGPDGDGNCSESCSESTDTCTFDDPDGSPCNDGIGPSVGDQCLSGTCLGGSGTVLCGDADGDGSVKSSDALRVLRAAVGQAVVCPMSRCDVDKSGAVQSSDALRVLRKAVGQSVVLSCPEP
jgi:cysteine-rich repeat protein